MEKMEVSAACATRGEGKQEREWGLINARAVDVAVVVEHENMVIWYREMIVIVWMCTIPCSAYTRRNSDSSKSKERRSCPNRASFFFWLLFSCVCV